MYINCSYYVRCSSFYITFFSYLLIYWTCETENIYPNNSKGIRKKRSAINKVGSACWCWYLLSLCRWSLIAGRVPGRTDNQVKNHRNTHLHKKLGLKRQNRKVVGTSKKTFYSAGSLEQTNTLSGNTDAKIMEVKMKTLHWLLMVRHLMEKHNGWAIILQSKWLFFKIFCNLPLFLKYVDLHLPLIENSSLENLSFL